MRTISPSRIALAFAAALFAVSAAPAFAFPFDSQRTDQPCSTCHVSPTGGPELTDLGRAYQAAGRVWPPPQLQTPAPEATTVPTAVSTAPPSDQQIQPPLIPLPQVTAAPPATVPPTAPPTAAATAVPAPTPPSPTAAPLPTAAPAAPAAPAPSPTPRAAPTSAVAPAVAPAQLPAGKATAPPGSLPSAGDDRPFDSLPVAMALFGLGILGVSLRFVRGTPRRR